MATEVILPRVDMDMTSGRVSRWYVAEGAMVEKGQPLFEIETDKAAMEIEAPASGVLGDILAAADTTIAVGSTIAWIYAAGESRRAAAPPTTAATPPPAVPIAATPAEPAAAPATPAELTATPLARRLARQHAITLDRLTGSGPRRRIQARDVAAFVAMATPATPAARLMDDAPAGGAPAGDVPAGGTGLHLAWLRQGTGRPLVLIHGFGAELNGWRPLVASLAAGRPILGVDLPGHGQSPAAAVPSLAGFADAVAAALAGAGISAADVVGHSLGAAVAACLAETAAFELHTLLLIAPGGLGPDINGAFLDGFTRARSEASLAPWLRLLVSDAAALGEGFIRATARARGDAARVAAQAEIARTLFPDGTQAFSIRDILARIAAPVRVVFGADDRIIPARHARDLPGNVALHLFRGVGHLPHLEMRPALARILAEHLR